MLRLASSFCFAGSPFSDPQKLSPSCSYSTKLLPAGISRWALGERAVNLYHVLEPAGLTVNTKPSTPASIAVSQELPGCAAASDAIIQKTRSSFDLIAISLLSLPPPSYSFASYPRRTQSIPSAKHRILCNLAAMHLFHSSLNN